MENLNYVFFEEFKHLDKICGELYNTNHGITNYIDDMKAVSFNDYRYIENWKTDLDLLVQFRHVRNNLAHTEGAFNEINCTQNDVEWIKGFYERIMNQSDPIAMLYKYYREKNNALKTNNKKLEHNKNLYTNNEQSMENKIPYTNDKIVEQYKTSYVDNQVSNKVDTSCYENEKNKELMWTKVLFAISIIFVMLLMYIIIEM